MSQLTNQIITGFFNRDINVFFEMERFQDDVYIDIKQVLDLEGNCIDSLIKRACNVNKKDYYVEIEKFLGV